MREHMPSSARVHYALIDAGGIAPNVVQALPKCGTIRARSCRDVGSGERVRSRAGAALMTETSVAPRALGRRQPGRQPPLERGNAAPTSTASARRLRRGRRRFAAEIQTTLRPRTSAPPMRATACRAEGRALCEEIYPLDAKAERSAPPMWARQLGGPDGAVPRRHATRRDAGHSWQLTAQGKAGRPTRGWSCRQGHGGGGRRCGADATLIARAKADLRRAPR